MKPEIMHAPERDVTPLCQKEKGEKCGVGIVRKKEERGRRCLWIGEQGEGKPRRKRKRETGRDVRGLLVRRVDEGGSEEVLCRFGWSVVVVFDFWL